MYVMCFFQYEGLKKEEIFYPDTTSYYWSSRYFTTTTPLPLRDDEVLDKTDELQNKESLNGLDSVKSPTATIIKENKKFTRKTSKNQTRITKKDDKPRNKDGASLNFKEATNSKERGMENKLEIIPPVENKDTTPLSGTKKSKNDDEVTEFITDFNSRITNTDGGTKELGVINGQKEAGLSKVGVFSVPEVRVEGAGRPNIGGSMEPEVREDGAGRPNLGGSIGQEVVAEGVGRPNVGSSMGPEVGAEEADRQYVSGSRGAEVRAKGAGRTKSKEVNDRSNEVDMSTKTQFDSNNEAVGSKMQGFRMNDITDMGVSKTQKGSGVKRMKAIASSTNPQRTQRVSTAN